MPALLQIRRFTLGPYATNCYVLWPTGHRGCWIVDASFDPAPIIQSVRDEGLTPERLLLTHAHVDHIAGVNEIKIAWPELPVAIHRLERDWLSDPLLNLSAMGGFDISAPAPDELLEGDEDLDLGPLSFRVLHVPGHSPGSVALYGAMGDIVVSGDALFAGSIGRTDFPGSDFEQLASSIRTKLYTLPPSTRVFPGHGPETTIGHEAMSNPFVRALPGRDKARGG